MQHQYKKPNPSNTKKDDAGQAPESGEPGVAGRSQGQVLDNAKGKEDLASKRHGQTPDAPESGRHTATPDR